MSKICKECELELPLVNFSSKQSVCRQCRSNKRKQTYNDKKKSLKQNKLIPENSRKLGEELSRLVTYLYGPDQDVETIEYHMKLCNKAFDDVKDSVLKLRYTIKTSDNLREFIKICDINELDLRYVQDAMRDKEFGEELFQEYFYMTLDEADKNIRDELEDLNMVMDAMYAAYDTLIKCRIRKDTAIKNRKGVTDNQRNHRYECSVSFDSNESEIVIHNSLNLNKLEFITEIRNTLKSSSDKAFIETFYLNGCYNEFFELLDIEKKE